MKKTKGGALSATYAPIDDSIGTEVANYMEFGIRLADTEVGRNSASMLVNRQYSWRGYESGHQVTEAPNRITLNATMKGSLVGTLTISIDNAEGLLADETFEEELDAYRLQGYRLCEFTKLAFDADGDSKYGLAALFHICYMYAHHVHHCSHAVIEVNPRHVRYYERMLGFNAHGDIRGNSRVNAPAQLLCLDFNYVEQQVATFGGTGDKAGATRSLYPYFFSSREEIGIVNRLKELE